METVAGLLFLATFVEGMIDYFAGENPTQSRPYLRYVSLAVGIALAVAYRVNIPEMLGITSSVVYVDWVVSGVIIGRGSNYLNDIIGMFRKA